jgi:hypothetical protein
MAMAHTRTFATIVLVVAAFAGRVIDEGTGRALDGVHVRAEGASTTETSTDRNGHFNLTNLKPGPYTVTTESDTVPTQQFHVTLGANHTTVLDMKVCSTRTDLHCGPPPKFGGLPL